MRTDRSIPWLGTGLIQDIELVMQILNLREFAEWLRTNGPPEHARFAREILSMEETLEAFECATDRVKADIACDPPATDPVSVVEVLDATACDAQRQLDRMRDVFCSVYALEDGDEETDLPDLLRALLS